MFMEFQMVKWYIGTLNNLVEWIWFEWYIVTILIYYQKILKIINFGTRNSNKKELY